jgi:hypothetical protein
MAECQIDAWNGLARRAVGLTGLDTADFAIHP